MASNRDYGSIGEYDPATESELRKLRRREKMAEMLAAQSIEPLQAQSTGRFTSAISPWQGIGKMAQAFAANRADSRNDAKYSEIVNALAEQQNTASNALVKGMSAKQYVNPDTGTPEVRGVRGVNGNMVLTEPAGGIEGGLAAMQGLPPSKYANEIRQTLALKLAEQDAEKQMAAYKATRVATEGDQTPSNIREWTAYQQMSPAEREEFLRMKRASQYLNTGGAYVTPNPANPAQNTVVAPIGLSPDKTPANVEAAAQAAAEGKGQGERAIDRPAAQAKVDTALQNLDLFRGAASELRNHPGLSQITGSVKGILPEKAFALSTDASNALSKFEQVVSNTFLKGITDLKASGTSVGQVAIVEGEKLQGAMAALKRIQDPDTFKNELDKLVTQIERSKAVIQKAHQEAYSGQNGSQPATPVEVNW